MALRPLLSIRPDLQTGDLLTAPLTRFLPCMVHVSRSWLQDGVLADLVRSCARKDEPGLQWVLFDGPVDAIWIENMNTVLDDNKKVTIAFVSCARFDLGCCSATVTFRTDDEDKRFTGGKRRRRLSVESFGPTKESCILRTAFVSSQNTSTGVQCQAYFRLKSSLPITADDLELRET